MPDVLIRNLSAEDLKLLDAQAKQLGLPRGEYLRRRLQAEARRTQSATTASDLARFSKLATDLADDGVMDSAWS